MKSSHAEPEVGVRTSVETELVQKESNDRWRNGHDVL